jgi:hypothetical protein
MISLIPIGGASCLLVFEIELIRKLAGILILLANSI